MEATRAINGRTYYPHVEGLRGVAAFYVFIFHIWQLGIQHPATATLAAWFVATKFLQYGHFAVAVFIVISGYCLALPVAQRPQLAFSIRTFFARRARRLMPAYLAVVFLSIVPFCVTGVLQGHHVNVPHIALALVLHLALIHNLSFLTSEYLNGSLWSIALEVQIYIAFALILIPVWRRFGIAAQLALALALGLLPHFVLHSFDWTAPWLCGLFGMGVAAAALTAQRPPFSPLVWKLLTLAAAVVAIVLIWPFVDGVTPDGALWPADIALGVVVALFFVASAGDANMLPVRVLASRPIVLLGTFSYSLYLIHAPIVDLVGTSLHYFHVGAALSVAVWIVLVVVIVAAAYGFYLVFERPFLSTTFRAARDIELHSKDLVEEPITIAPAVATGL